MSIKLVESTYYYWWKVGRLGGAVGRITVALGQPAKSNPLCTIYPPRLVGIYEVSKKKKKVVRERQKQISRLIGIGMYAPS